MNYSRVSASRISLQPVLPNYASALPFLYLTPTILQPWKRYASQQTKPRARASKFSQSSAKQQTKAARKRPHSAFDEELQMPALSNPFVDPLKKSRPKRPVKEDFGEDQIRGNANIFAKIVHEHSVANTKQRTISPRRTITMTQAEEEIFARLQALSLKTKPTPPAKDKPLDEFDDLDTGQLSLEELFNNIAFDLDYQKRREDQAPSRELAYHEEQRKKEESDDREQQNTLLQSIAWPELTHYKALQLQLPAPEQKNQIAETSKSGATRYQLELQDLSRSVTSDAELWEILDKQVFGMMRELNTMLEAKDIKKGLIKNETFAVRPAAKQFPGVFNAKSLEERSLIEKVTSTYGPALLYAARIFRSVFPTSQFSALLLPTIKNLGPISYVLAASTSLYNELLYIHWECYRDLDGCAGLIEEMTARNILADRHTALVYQAVKDTRDSELGISQHNASSLILRQSDDFDAATPDLTTAPEIDWSQRGTSYIPFGIRIGSFKEGYWRLQGVETAWLRLSRSYNRLVAITRQEIQRRKDEEESIARSTGNLDAQTVLEDVAVIKRDGQDEIDGEPEVEIIPTEYSGNLLVADASS